ncbi:MAG: acyltransferase [Bacteroidaceae bacterium]|nr:acyltransferase [Bacteroidaceae bacterium]
MIKKFREIVRLLAIYPRQRYLGLYGMHISPSARISFGAKLDKTNGKGITIGDESFVASGALVLSHDFCRRKHAETIIGKQCFIGAGSIILPGVSIGDHCIIGAGAVVTKDVPANSVVAGNPAQVIKSGIMTGKYGKLLKNT